MEREVKKESTLQLKNSEYSNISIDLQSQVLNNINWESSLDIANLKTSNKREKYRIKSYLNDHNMHFFLK